MTTVKDLIPDIMGDRDNWSLTIKAPCQALEQSKLADVLNGVEPYRIFLNHYGDDDELTEVFATRGDWIDSETEVEQIY